MKQKHIHFIGICGVAMSALALAFKREGWKVTGSDVGFYPPISTYLKESDVDYYPGWHPEKMVANGKPDLVVVGNVAGSTNPEWIYVQEHKLNYKSYPDVIKEFFIKKNSIVCAGTYGKSTSTTLLTWILKECGFDPSYMFGGLSQNDLPAAGMNASDWSIMEGDEYKSSRWDTGPKFAYYSPTHLLLTSIVWDHADVYPTEAAYQTVFKKLFESIPKIGLRVISEQAKNVLDTTASGLYSLFKLKSPKDAKTVTYGKNVVNDYVYGNLAQTKEGLSFDIVHNQKTFTLKTSCFGDFMADNIAGCFAMAHELGIPDEKIITAIGTFKGMKRRLEKRSEGKIIIFDDIAHSPIKAKSILETLKAVYQTKLIAVFEPNTGNRRPQAEPWYDNAFFAADEVVIPHLTKVKNNPDEEAPFEGEQLAKIISKTHSSASYVEEDSKVITHLLSQPSGSVIVFLGSHGFRGMIENLIDKNK